jgi:hypothetical protein
MDALFADEAIFQELDSVLNQLRIEPNSPVQTDFPPSYFDLSKTNTPMIPLSDDVKRLVMQEATLASSLTLPNIKTAPTTPSLN